MNRGAILSDCQQYRYALWRIWAADRPTVLFIGLNPSTADATSDDPTLRRCVGFARDWGYGGLYLLNLFAYRATDPARLRQAADPVGPANDAWLRQVAATAGLAVAAWGNHGSYRQRNQAVQRIIPTLHQLKTTKRGNPAHPLYLPRGLRPVLLE
jgi:hypothetical protein